ncbi:hypothetical protein AVEN_76650-1 [Araneus ventricosus]|uniref:Uncharacterized protein n=1 Tax=Araneus ventricosus TaxID=182803 RepID=A0A4Y2BNY1_ARAVE|nr:hypothetical protein AVEN_76650-1 [Araneus ventricosus]
MTPVGKGECGWESVWRNQSGRGPLLTGGENRFERGERRRRTGLGNRVDHMSSTVACRLPHYSPFSREIEKYFSTVHSLRSKPSDSPSAPKIGPISTQLLNPILSNEFLTVNFSIRHLSQRITGLKPFLPFIANDPGKKSDEALNHLCALSLSSIPLYWVTLRLVSSPEG